VPGAESRVFDELAALALDPAPGTQGEWRLQQQLDNADAVIERSAVRFVDEGDHSPVSFCGVFSGIMYLTDHNDSVFSLDIPRDLAIESGR
jgi:hypothetical protein